VAVRRARSEDRYREDLVRAKEELEQRVQERTASLENALAQKDVLFRELNHRVKNNLQMVSSLLRLQASRSLDAKMTDGMQSCLSRIQAMGVIHELLYRNDTLKQLDFGQYLKVLCARLTDAYGEGDRVPVRVESERAELDLNAAVPLALFVNELVSNAFKHAFPGGRRGSITVSFRQRGSQYVLGISDDGVGFDAEKARTGSLGLDLARGWARQIGGTLTQADCERGAAFVLEFPVAAEPGREAAA
jgi:two-component sensor histidine kinase